MKLEKTIHINMLADYMVMLDCGEKTKLTVAYT